MNAQDAARNRYLHEQNQRYPLHLVPVPRDEWPDNMPVGLVAVWRSRNFLVEVFAPVHGATRLSILHTHVGNDGHWTDGITWDELQRLKGECGFGDRFAVEIFPAVDEVVNVANLRHLWVLDAPPPFAWRQGRE